MTKKFVHLLRGPGNNRMKSWFMSTEVHFTVMQDFFKTGWIMTSEASVATISFPILSYKDLIFLSPKVLNFDRD